MLGNGPFSFPKMLQFLKDLQSSAVMGAGKTSFIVSIVIVVFGSLFGSHVVTHPQLLLKAGYHANHGGTL